MKIPKARKLPSGMWFIQLRLGGVSIPVTGKTEKKCRDAAALIKAEYTAGKRSIKKKSAEPTLSEAIARYIDDRRAVLSPSTIRGYIQIMEYRFQSCAQLPIGEITNWQKIIEQEAKAGASAKTIKNAWGLVRSVLKNEGIVPPDVRLPQVPQKPIKWLTPEEIPAFIEAVHGSEFEIPALLALHGLRRSEIFGLTWGSIDIDRNLIHVNGAAVVDANQKLVRKPTNKNASSQRYVPILIPALQDALRKRREQCTEDDPIFPHSHPNTLYRRINTACVSAGLPEVGVHGLRHSFASLCYHLGLSEQETMELGGWSDPVVMRKIYIKVSEKDKKQAHEKLLDFFKNANENANK